MTILQTPEERFKNIPDFPYQPQYLEVEDSDLGQLRLAYVDEGSKDAPVILCMHGEPSWSYLYRKMIPVFLDAGYRVIAPDLIGFGRSDKPADRNAYTYSKHVAWMSSWFKALELDEVTLVAQDWGGLIGLRMVAEMPDRFARVSLSNTGLPMGDIEDVTDFINWRDFSQADEAFDAGLIVNWFDKGVLSEAEKNAYRAPFPSEEYKAGARQFPLIVPISPDQTGADDNREAAEVLRRWEKPMLLCFSDGDPITKPWEKFFIEEVPGTKGQPHITLHGLHFIQEQDGKRWASSVIDWMKD